MNNLRGLLHRLFALIGSQCTRKCAKEGPGIARGVSPVTPAHGIVAIVTDFGGHYKHDDEWLLGREDVE